ncbi:MAG: monovalent cation/H+ antiporter complex subunit F [Chloroflexota bacterium]
MAWIDWVVNGSLVIMAVMIPLAFYRVAKPGQEAIERLVGVDLITNLIVGIVVLLAIVAGTDTTIDIGITLAALSFAATVGIARYVSEGRIF